MKCRPVEPDANWIRFTEMALQRFGKQAPQLVYPYVRGDDWYPRLDWGLRFRSDPKDGHILQIHKDDVEEFVRRVQADGEFRRRKRELESREGPLP